MPWVLLALLAGAGGLYYEANKGRATNTRWELHFPASSAIILSGLMDAVIPLGGTVLDQGSGVYIVSVPAKVDLSHALPPNLVPPNMVISGDNFDRGPRWGLDSYLQEDDRMPSIDVAGMRWDGQRLK